MSIRILALLSQDPSRRWTGESPSLAAEEYPSLQDDTGSEMDQTAIVWAGGGNYCAV